MGVASEQEDIESERREKEMEASKNMRVIAVAMVVMLVFAGQASAGFLCFGICVTKCSIETKKPLSCAFKCLKQCLLPVDSTPNPLYYCQLGCSMDECATKLSHDSEAMESCVDNCRSNVCMHA